jgi:hypothetical protein
MASATTSPPSISLPSDPGIFTPANPGARAALLRHSLPAAEGEVSSSPAYGQTTQTPSSPLNAASHAAATEGAQRANIFSLHDLDQSRQRPPVSVAETADRLAREQTEAHNIKVAVFKAFCSSFDETAKQFTSGPAFRFAQDFTCGFLQYWEQTLSGTTPKAANSQPTYASVTANHAHVGGPHVPPSYGPAVQRPQQWQQQCRQGQQAPVAPPKDDLRVFARLSADSSAWDTPSYTVRTHIAGKLGIGLQKIPQANRCKTGWAVRTSDLATRDLLINRQNEWAGDLGAATVETRQKWFTYVVPECPRRITDLRGFEVDQVAAIEDEVKAQTGMAPISIRNSQHDSDEHPTKTLIISFLQPSKRRWRLFGTSQLARIVEKTRPPNQCDTCWGFHSKYSCNHHPRCGRCGKLNHTTESCTAPEQCANCLGPHAADFPKCPARPKRVNGMIRLLTRDQRSLIRKMGNKLFLQHNPEPLESSSTRDPSSAPEASSPCIRVATIPEEEDERSRRRPISPMKRRRGPDPPSS